MPSPGKGPQSNFAAAAKVLFESAQKSGAVKPLEKSGLEYAQQLKKIQNQSKKRGGSLGGVSYKVAEFLAAQRTPPPVRQSTRRSDVTLARKVPLINLSVATEDKPAESRIPVTKADPLPATTAAPVKEVADLPETTVVADAEEPPQQPEEIAVVEDEPLFQTRPTSKPAESVVHRTVAAAAGGARDVAPTSLNEKKPRIKPPTPIIAVPVAPQNTSENAHSQSEAGASSGGTSISMDIWEQQREREIQRLQQKQEEIERQRLAVQLEEEHQTLGAQWVEQRTVTSRGQPLTAEQLVVQGIMRATDVEAMLKGLQQIANGGTKSAAYLPVAVSTIAHQVSRMKPLQREDGTAKLLDALSKLSAAPELVTKAQLVLTRGDGFLAAYNELGSASKERLDKPVARKAIPVLMQHGQWLEALEIVDSSPKTFVDRNSQLALTALLHTRQLDPEAKAAVRSHVVRTLTSSGSLSKQAKLALAVSEEGPNRRSSLQQLTAGTDADENIYAALILRTSAEDIPALLIEMEKRGLNKDDPVVLKSLLFKSLDPEDPSNTFREIEQQQDQIGLRPFHYIAAAKAAQLHPDEDTIRRAARVLLSGDATYGAPALRKLLPLLYERRMFDDIVALADHYGKYVPLEVTFPRAIAFVNEALEHVGRATVSGVRVKDINFIPPSAKAQKDGERPRLVSTTDLSSLTEKMLVYAKDRQWAQALEVVESLHVESAEDAAALTLIYNCALSAAVEQPEVLQAIYSFMKERSVAVNPTTVNTVLSSYSKFGNWQDAIDFFDAVPSATRDSNTFLVQLSLLGKQNLWVEASAVYDQMRKAVNKPPASMFAVAIGATSSHNWSVTLKMFQDMLKLHGASVKENVVNQVVRCLEQNNRTVELGKLEKDLAKRKKKGKK